MIDEAANVNDPELLPAGVPVPGAGTPCLCTALRRAARAVTRVYDAELRAVGLRVTQYALLSLLGRVGEVRQSELSALTYLEETSLTRALRVLNQSGWISVRAGEDRREKWYALTEAGKARLEHARPAWLQAQERLQQGMPDGVWTTLFAVLPSAAQAAAEL